MENFAFSEPLEYDPLFLAIHDEEEIFSEELPLVDKTVRRCYFNYMKNVLINNLHKSYSCLNYEISDIITKLALEIELKALRSCMVSSIYRNSMLNEINKIKYFTANNILYVDVKAELSKQTNKQNGDSMIENEPFEVKEEPCASQSNNNGNESSETETDYLCHSPSANQGENSDESVYDEILEKMKKMFEPDEKENDLNENNSSCSSCSETPNKNFWILESQHNKYVLNQKMAAVNELNPNKYCKVHSNILAIFGEESSSSNEETLSSKEIMYICKRRITLHVRNVLSVQYKKKRFRSVDEFRILAKNLVARCLQIDPYLEYKIIFKAVDLVFRERNVIIRSLADIQEVGNAIVEHMSVNQP